MGPAVCLAHMVTRGYRETDSPAIVSVLPTFVETTLLLVSEQYPGLSKWAGRVQTAGLP